MSAGAGRPLVLVADDDADIRDLVMLGLRGADIDVIAAADGREALELARSRAPDVALLDVSMPNLSGYDVIEQLRRDEATRGLAIMVLTARARDSDIAHGQAVGADDYMTKPFSPRELRERVLSLLGRA